ncbi:hypothetical protein ACFQE5_23145 [Pseudonocardia hispaniensis]|uniref:Uncharacterized protein n=1 Tax=Pseudonocardia hispaniensis TaxID=904933 RepID=A0ABW1J8C5_9PSEU
MDEDTGGFPPFATPEELRIFLRREQGQLDEHLAVLMLDMAGDAIRAETRQILDEVVDDELTIDRPGGGRILCLPELPVTAVSAVVEHGVALTHGVDYTWAGSGVLTRIGRCWPTEQRAVTVTYTHGYPPRRRPGILRTVALQIAGRAVINPEQVTQLSIGDYSRSWQTAGTGRTGRIELTDWERTQLAELRRYR